jgi:hypothetical protein
LTYNNSAKINGHPLRYIREIGEKKSPKPGENWGINPYIRKNNPTIINNILKATNGMLTRWLKDK